MSLGLASALTGIVFIGMGLGLRLGLKEPSRAITYLRHKPLTLALYSLACLWFSRPYPFTVAFTPIYFPMVFI